MDDLEKMAKYYISLSEKKLQEMDRSGLVLLHDYTDDLFLKKIDKLTKTNISPEFKRIEYPVDSTFLDNLIAVLIKMDNDKISSFFTRICNLAHISRSKDLDVSETSTRIGQKNGEIVFDITLPELECDTNTLHAALIHELSHFSLFLGKDRIDAYEYSEVLSMFFEYMMYEIISKGKGDMEFIHNRLSMLKDTLVDIKDDLVFAANPHYLQIDRKYYSTSLASNLAYPIGFEYVLQLIERREEDPKYVDEIIGNLLLGEDTLYSASKTLDINTENYTKIYKLLK